MALTVKTRIDELIVEVPRAHTALDRWVWLGIFASGCLLVVVLLWRPPPGAPPPAAPWILSEPERCEGPAMPDACGAELAALWRTPNQDEAILARERGRLHTAFPAAFPIDDPLPPLPDAWGVLEPDDATLIQELLRDRPPLDHPALHNSPWLIRSSLAHDATRPPTQSGLTTPADTELRLLVEAGIVHLRDGVLRLSQRHPDGSWLAELIRRDLARYDFLLERARARAVDAARREARFEHQLALLLHSEQAHRQRLAHERSTRHRAGVVLACGLVLAGIAWRRRRRTAALVVSHHALSIDDVRLLWEDLRSVRIDPDRIGWEDQAGQQGQVDHLRFTAEVAGTLLQVFDHRLNHPREPRDPALEAQLEALISGRSGSAGPTDLRRSGAPASEGADQGATDGV